MEARRQQQQQALPSVHGNPNTGANGDGIAHGRGGAMHASISGSEKETVRPMEDSPLPPILIGSRSLNLQAESRATAELSGKLLLKRKTKHDLNNLLMETWLNDVLSAGADSETDPALLVTGQVSNGLKRFGLSRAELVERGISGAQVDRLYRSIYVYTVGFHDLLRELFGHNRSCREHVAAVWRSVLAVSERALKVQFRSEYVNLVYDYEVSNVNLSDAMTRIGQLEGLLASTNNRNQELEREKNTIQTEHAVYENERQTLIESLEKEEKANHHTMQKYTLEIEHRSELQRQMVKLRTDLAGVTRDRNEAVEKIRSFKREYELLLTNYEDLKGSEVSLSESLRSASARNTFLETRQEELRSQIEDFQAKADTASTRHQQEVRMKTFLKGELQTKNDKLNILESKVETLNRNMSDYEEESTILKEKLAEQEKHIAVLEATVDSEKSDKDRSIGMYNRMESDLKVALEEVKDWTANCDRLTTENEELTCSQTRVDEENASLRMDLREKERRLQMALAGQEVEASNKHQIAAGLSVVMQHMDFMQKISNLRWRRSNESMNRVVMLEDELLKLHESMRVAGLKSEDLQSRLNESEGHNAELVKTVEVLQIKSDEVGGANDKLLAQLRRVEKALSESEKQCKSVSAKCTAAESELEGVQAELKAKEATMRLKEAQSFKISDEMRALQAELGARQSQAQQWQREHEKVEQLQRNTVESMKALQKEHDALRDTLESREEQLASLEIELKELGIRLEGKRKKKRHWKARAGELTTAIEEHECSIKSLDERLDAKTKSEDHLRTELSGERSERAAEQSYFAQKEKGYQLQLSEIQEILSTTKASLCDCESQNTDLKASLATTRQALGDKCEELERLTQSHKELMEMKEFLQDDLREVKLKDYNLEQQMNALSNENASLKDASSSLVRDHEADVARTTAEHEAEICRLRKEITERNAGFIADVDCMKEEFNEGIATAMHQKDAAIQESQELSSEIGELRTQINGLRIRNANSRGSASSTDNSAFRALAYLTEDLGSITATGTETSKSRVLTKALKSAAFGADVMLALTDELHRLLVSHADILVGRQAGLVRFLYARFLMLLGGDQKLAQFHTKRLIDCFASSTTTVHVSSRETMGALSKSPGVGDSDRDNDVKDKDKATTGSEEDDNARPDSADDRSNADNVVTHIGLMRRLLCVDSRGLSLPMSRLYVKLMKLCCKQSSSAGGSTDFSSKSPEASHFTHLLDMRVTLESIPGILETALSFRDTEAAEFVSSLRKKSIISAVGHGGKEHQEIESISLCHLLEKVFDSLDDKRRILIERLRRNFTEALGVDAMEKEAFKIASLVEVLKKDYIVKGDIIVVNGTEFNITDGEIYERLVTRTELDVAIHSETFAECIYEILYDNATPSEGFGWALSDEEDEDTKSAVASFLTRNVRDEDSPALSSTGATHSKFGELQEVLMYGVIRSFVSRIQDCLQEQRDADREVTDPGLIRRVESLYTKLARKRVVKQEEMLREYTEIFFTEDRDA